MSKKNVKMDYALNGEEFKLIKKNEEGDEWWKSVPLGYGVGSAFHTGRNPQFNNHFDHYENGELVRREEINIEQTGITTIGSQWTEFKKKPDTQIFVIPDPNKITEGKKPDIETGGSGDTFKVRSNIPVFVIWGSTRSGVYIKIGS